MSQNVRLRLLCQGCHTRRVRQSTGTFTPHAGWTSMQSWGQVSTWLKMVASSNEVPPVPHCRSSAAVPLPSPVKSLRAAQLLHNCRLVMSTPS